MSDYALCAEFLSASVATSFKNVSAALRGHSFTESVDFASLSFLGLVGLFHDDIPPSLRTFIFLLSTIYKYINAKPL